jgi:lambda family phage portal protein
VIARLKGFDVFEDAALVQQQVAACLAGFITDTDGTGVAVGDKDASDPLLETIQPGTLQKLPVGKSITFTTPPRPVDGRFDQRQLRAIAAGLGITYEELTGDYSAVNFSSARMARLAHWANVHDWRWNLIIPMFCGPCWDWAMETAFIAGSIGDTPAAEWTPPPMPLIEPDKEARAGITRVRGGQALFDDLVREQGLDPETFWPEYAANLKRLDDLGIVLDSDARKTTQAGNPTDPGESSGKVGNSEE